MTGFSLFYCIIRIDINYSCHKSSFGIKPIQFFALHWQGVSLRLDADPYEYTISSAGLMEVTQNFNFCKYLYRVAIS